MPESDQAEAIDAERRRRIGVRVVVIGSLALALIMVAFGTMTSRNYERFSTYQKATLEDPDHPPRWQVEALDIEGCVDEVLIWIEACPGVSSWCESSLPSVMDDCLSTQDRTEFCAAAGDTVLSTRFGYDECAERYDGIDGKYARRAAKKHCALLYRTIAGHCKPVAQQ